MLSGEISGIVTAKRALQPGEVTVTVLTPDGKTMATATVGTDGTYLVKRLVPGSYVVLFTTGSGSTLESTYFDKAKTLSKATPVTVRAGQTTTRIDATLKAK